MRNEARDGVQVIDRVSALLRALGNSRRPVQLRDLSAQTGLSKSTARRLLVSLASNGLCEQTASGGYQLGIELFLLGQKVQDSLEVRERARPIMEQLGERWHHTVFLCVRAGDHAVCVDRVDSGEVYGLAFRVGALLPLHLAAAPRAILAWLPDADIHRYIDSVGPLPRYTERSITDPDQLFDFLQASRLQGWVLSEDDVAEGIAAIAAPVFDHNGRVVAAISASGIVQQVVHVERDELALDIVAAANAISRAVGFRAGGPEG